MSEIGGAEATSRRGWTNQDPRGGGTTAARLVRAVPTTPGTSAVPAPSGKAGTRAPPTMRAGIPAGTPLKPLEGCDAHEVTQLALAFLLQYVPTWLAMVCCQVVTPLLALELKPLLAQFT